MEFIDLKTQYEKLKYKINNNIQNVLNNGNYIMGDEVKRLEERLAEYVGVKYCATCANGTDALEIALMCYGIGKDDVIFVPSFTFFSTAEVVSSVGATPIFVDCDERTFNINPNKLEKAINDALAKKMNVKGVIAVDLFGLPADYNRIKEITKKYHLFLIEDGAQGFGGSLNGKKNCSFGDIATTSFFPAKPLGCYGDGGALFTNNKEIYDLICSLRVHGKGKEKYDNVRIGMNSRLDTIQAAILHAKLDAFIEYELDNRNTFAKLYTEKLKNYVVTPLIENNYISSYAQYTIELKDSKERDFLKDYLGKCGIPTMVYYPKPLHKQKVYSDYKFNLDDLSVSEKLSECVLSLPMHPYLDGEIINDICNKVIEGLEAYQNE